MDQGGTGGALPSPRATFARAAEALLVLAVVLLLLVERGGRAAMGLRLSEENSLLAALTGASERFGATLRQSVVLSALVFAAAGLGGGRRSLRTSLAAAAALAAVGLALAWDRGAVDRPMALLSGLAPLAAAAVAVVPAGWRALVPLSGTAGAVWWLHSTAGGDPGSDVLEAASEALLLAGVVLALLPTRSAAIPLAPRTITGLLLGAAPVATLLALWPAIGRHLLGHVLHLDRAGLPYFVVAGLLSVAAAAAGARFLADYRSRRVAFACLLLLAGARGAETEDAALRAAAALAFAGAYRDDG